MKSFRMNFKLTAEQWRVISPLFDEAGKNFSEGSPGVINAQILNSEQADCEKDEICIQGAFIEKPWALKIFDIIEDWRNKNRLK